MAAVWFRLSSFNVLLAGVSVFFAGGSSTSSSSVYSARDSIIASGLFTSFAGCVIVVFAVVSESLGVSVKRYVTKFVASAAFNERAIFPRVAGFFAVTAYDELVIVNHSTPFTTDIKRIRDRWRGKYHSYESITIF